MSNSIPTLREIRAARARIAGRVHETPLVTSTRIGDSVGVRLYLKCENLQKTGSFKPRGILNRLMTLDQDSKQRGVVTISAGNAAQALAWAAAQVEVPATVVMPANASPVKAAASRGYGAEVILHGDVHQAFEKVHQLERERGLTFVHPFDDPHVIAGHGSAGLEIIERLPEVTVIVVPVGGGGQIAGIAAAVKQVREDVRIYGVEPEGACAMRRSLDAGSPQHLESVHSVADGLAPPMAGVLNYEVVARYVDDIVLVSDEEIVAAMGRIITDTKLVTEPSGAAATAALLEARCPVNVDDVVVSVLSGGNVNLGQLVEFAAVWDRSDRLTSDG